MSRVRLVVLQLLTLVLLASCASTNPPRGALPDDTATVEAFFRSGIEAFNRHELDEFMRQFGPDIQMYTPTGWLRGKDAVRERFAGTFRQFPAVRMELEELNVRQVSAETITTDFRWRVYPMGQGPAFHGVGSGVYVRRGDVWEEVLEHETVTRVDEALNVPGGPGQPPPG